MIKGAACDVLVEGASEDVQDQQEVHLRPWACVCQAQGSRGEPGSRSAWGVVLWRVKWTVKAAHRVQQTKKNINSAAAGMAGGLINIDLWCHHASETVTGH